VKELRVNKVLSMTRPTATGAGAVVTDRSGTLALRRSDLADTLAGLTQQRAIASLEYDAATREVTAVGSAPTDIVMMASPTAFGLSVHLMKRPTLLELSGAHPRFQELFKLLREAQTDRRRVSIGVLPGGRRIEDVRLEETPP
jgi:hypothetical protein